MKYLKLLLALLLLSSLPAAAALRSVLQTTVSAGTTTSTFNPSDLLNMTLSNGNLTATSTSSTGDPQVRSTTSKSAGKVHVEFTITAHATATTDNLGVGIASASHVFTNFTGQELTSVGMYPSTTLGNIELNNASTVLRLRANAADVIAMEIDFGANLIWWKNVTAASGWNNDVIGNQNPATGTGGFSISTMTNSPFFVIVDIEHSTDAITVNFGDTAFALTPSVGFSGWSQTYVGPGDVVASATAWWGLRGYTAAYSEGGNAAIDVCDTATGLTCTTGIKILPTGNLDVATASAAAACATQCSVTKLYDQTGNGNHLVQATIASAPVLTFNCVNSGLPCLTYLKASQQYLGIASFGTQANPYSLSFVGERTASFTATANMIGDSAGTGPPLMYFNSIANQVDGCATSCLVSALSANDSVFHAVHGTFSASTFTMYVDGTSTTGNVATVGGSLTGTIFRIGNNTTANGGMSGKITEVGIWPGAQSSGSVGSLVTNERNYWNF